MDEFKAVLALVLFWGTPIYLWRYGIFGYLIWGLCVYAAFHLIKNVE